MDALTSNGLNDLTYVVCFGIYYLVLNSQTLIFLLFIPPEHQLCESLQRLISDN